MTTQITYSDAEVLCIAKHQKTIIWLILLSIPAYVAVVFIPFLPLIVGIISLFFIYQLAAALKASAPWLWVVLALIPCVGLIALLVINSSATSALKARGIRVGLMGARKDDLDKIASSAA
jgi:hypothetical protein